MDPKPPYIPISCDLYDQYEIWAMHKTLLYIQYIVEGKSHEISDTIHTLVTRNKEEYLITVEGVEIRLDHIAAIREN